MLEEQTSRNTLLEKKQRKFDAEIGLLNEAKRHEETAKDKSVRECDQLKANKFQLEDQVQVSRVIEFTIALSRTKNNSFKMMNAKQNYRLLKWTSTSKWKRSIH